MTKEHSWSLSYIYIQCSTCINIFQAPIISYWQSKILVVQQVESLAFFR